MNFKALFFLLFSSALLNAQSNTDSTKLLIGQFPESTELYIKVARQNLFSSIDTASIYLNKALAVANKNGEPYEKARVFDNLGIYYGIQSRYDSAMYFYNKSEAIFRELKEELALANVLNNSGLTLFKKGDFEQSILRYQEAVDLYDKLANFDKAARTNNNLGLIFSEIGEPTKALEYFNTSLLMAKEAKNEDSYFAALNGKADVLVNSQANYAAGIILFDSVYHFFNNTNQPYFAAKAANNLGDCYQQLKNYPKALAYFLESLQIKKQFGDRELLISGYESLSDLHVKQQHYDVSLVYIDSAINIANEIKSLSWLVYCTQTKADILLKSAQYKAASALFSEVLILQDSLNQQEQAATVLELNEKYKGAQKDKALLVLNIKNEKQQQEMELNKVKYLSAGLVALLLFAGVVFYFVQLRQRDKLRQMLLNEELDGLRLRIGKIMSDVKLDKIAIDKESKKEELLDPLTEREIEILKEAITNKSNSEIAEVLFISTNTVKYHLKNIYTKIGVSSKLEARAFFT